MSKRYLDSTNRVVFVSAGIGRDAYGAFRRSAAGGLHRVVSRMLPMAPERAVAEANLEMYASARRWIEIPSAEDLHGLLLASGEDVSRKTIEGWNETERGEAARGLAAMVASLEGMRLARAKKSGRR